MTYFIASSSSLPDGHALRRTTSQEIDRSWAATCTQSAATGSGYEQAEAKVRCIQSGEVAVALRPPARDEVITEAAHCAPLSLRSDRGPHRDSATYTIVQVCFGPAPVGLEETVRAVPRNEHRLYAGSDSTGLLGQRRPSYEEVADLRQIIASQPEPTTPCGLTAVEREHHHAACHAPHLAQARDRVLPMMNGGNSHRGVEGLVLERKALRGS